MGRAPTRERSALATVVVLCAFATACGGAAPRRLESPGLAPEDPTPLARCRVGQSAASPLVTEWPASEKAHLQTRLAMGPVAVSYSGCELRIVDACRVPGSYAWKRTTLATDTVEITNADELYAKLPLGALSLEGELSRTGRLAVKTTVAGQFLVDGAPEAQVPKTSACAGVTHVVSGVSVGAFKMLSGGSLHAGADAVVASASTSSSENVLREAGIPGSCEQSTDEAADPQCASPIQVFLTSTAAVTVDVPKTGRDDQEEGRRSGVLIHFPAPDDPKEHWTLRDYEGKELCSLPCERWVRPNSGHYLQRQRSGSSTLDTVKLPDTFPQPPGSRVDATYRVERGSPLWSTLNFWGVGVPTAALGTVLVVWGFVGRCDISDPDWGTDDCEKETEVGLIVGGVFELGIAAASTYWYFWSHPGSVETHAPGETQEALRLGIGPGGLVGVF